MKVHIRERFTREKMCRNPKATGETIEFHMFRMHYLVGVTSLESVELCARCEELATDELRMTLKGK